MGTLQEGELHRRGDTKDHHPDYYVAKAKAAAAAAPPNALPVLQRTYTRIACDVGAAAVEFLIKLPEGQTTLPQKTLDALAHAFQFRHPGARGKWTAVVSLLGSDGYRITGTTTDGAHVMRERTQRAYDAARQTKDETK